MRTGSTRWPGRSDAVVVKFYRPERWPNAAILEEHEFALELARAEIPVIAPDVHRAQLVRARGFRYAVYPRRVGVCPNSEPGDDRQWMGRFLARIPSDRSQRAYFATVLASTGACSVRTPPTTARYRLDSVAPGSGLASRWPRTCCVVVEQRFDEAQPLRTLRLHGECHPGNVLWTDKGPHFVDLDDA
jgi:Ser/Thr protein kinase RdoA (MazF antagonist)